MAFDNPVNPVPKVRRPTPVKPPVDPFAQQEQELVAKRKTQEDELKAKIAANEGEVNAQIGELDKRQAADAAQVQQMMQHAPQSPQQSFQAAHKSLNDMSGMLLVLAALGGATTRQPFTASLNNMSAVIQGFMKGDQMAMEQQYKEFQANFQKGKEAHQAFQDELKAITEKNRGDYQTMSEKIRLLQLKHGYSQDLMRDNLKGVDQELKRLHDDRAASDRAMKQAEAEAKRMDAFMKAVGAGRQSGVGSPEDYAVMKDWARRYLSDPTKAAMPPFGLGEKGAQEREMFRRAVVEVEKEMNVKPEDSALKHAQVVSDRGALTQMTKWEAGVDRGEKQIEKNLELMSGYAERLGMSNIKSINRAVLAGKREFGDPTAQAYANAAYTVINEYARIQAGPTSNAMLSVSATKQAHEMLDTAMSPRQFKEVTGLMRKEIKNAVASAQESKATIEGRLRGQKKEAETGGGAGPYEDAEKERRYQEWKAKHAD